MGFKVSAPLRQSLGNVYNKLLSGGTSPAGFTKENQRGRVKTPKPFAYQTAAMKTANLELKI